MFKWDDIQRTDDGKVLLLYRHERIFEEGLVSPGHRVLDVGGWGVLAQRLLEEGAQCLILDNFTEDQYYPERVRLLPHIKGDITQSTLGFGAAYDLITCFEMLEHCGNQALGVSNMYGLLKPGGVLVGTFPIPGHSHAEDDHTVCFLDEGELGALLQQAGFSDIFIEATGSIAEGDVPSSLYFRATKAAE